MAQYSLRENPGTNELHLFKSNSSISQCGAVKQQNTNLTPYSYENDLQARTGCATRQNTGSMVCGNCVKTLYRT